MQVTEVEVDGLKRQFKVVLPAADIDAQVETRLKSLSSEVRLPGFRPGKVPLSLLRQRFGASVRVEILEKVVETSSNQAIADRGLRPAMQPKIEVTSFEGDLEYTMAVELMPEITPMDFSTLSLTRPKADVDDAEVEEAIERIAKQRRASTPVEEARPLAAGDLAVIDYLGRVDDVAFEGGAATDAEVEIGSNTFIPGFEEQLIGLSVGETREFEVTFPADYGVATLAGKLAKFEVTGKGIKSLAPVAIDDELGKGMGFDDLAEMRTFVRERIEREHAQASRAKVKRALLDKLAEAHPFAPPPSMVEAEFQSIWKQIQEARERGANDPDLDGKSDAEIETEYRAIADRRVRLGLLLAEVGRLNNIQVTEDQLKRAIIDEARRYPGQERQVIEFYSKQPEALAGIRAPLFEEKVVDFILEIAKVDDQMVTREALFADAEGETGVAA